MITTSPKTIQIECHERKEERVSSPKPKSYTFHIPIATTEYKAAPFNYQAATVAGLTRSGRVYDHTGKATAMSREREDEMKEDEKMSFTKLIKASEYKVTEQLAQTPARISLMSLLISSDAHR